MSLNEIGEAFKKLDRQVRQQLLKELPRLLDAGEKTIALQKCAESLFDFWNNPEDAVYDDL